jgi:hypothetical protein
MCTIAVEILTKTHPDLLRPPTPIFSSQHDWQNFHMPPNDLPHSKRIPVRLLHVAFLNGQGLRGNGT